MIRPCECCGVRYDGEACKFCARLESLKAEVACLREMLGHQEDEQP